MKPPRMKPPRPTFLAPLALAAAFLVAFSLTDSYFERALAQAGTTPPPPPPPSQSSPAAPAAPPPAAPPPRQPAPPAPSAPAQPSRPMVPIAPKDPAELSTLQSALAEQQKTMAAQKAYFEEGNRHLQEQNAEIQAYEKIAQAQIEDIKKKEGWGPEVQFNRATGKFEKPLPGGKAAAPKSAPIYKDTNPKKEDKK